MSSKRYTPILLFALIYLALIVIANILMTSKLHDQSVSPVGRTSETAFFPQGHSPEPSKMSKNPLRPDRPLGYNIVEQRRLIPHNQQQWEEFIKRTMQETEALQNVRQDPGYAGLKKSKEEWQQQRRYIERLIAQYEQLQRQNPQDTGLNSKLQDLYMLRATLQATEKDLVVEKK